ncbi:hypothetical protein VIAQ111709_10620 [Vibrio aquimaris]|uniref:Uncharacterized protein n=1 Tax=Vibrio aquimaris TaxID=2587862 RepID=A0A5P9CKT1_9VIBR|nr:hypothetical protein FIV01_08945 [Vibrio aquimaris]
MLNDLFPNLERKSLILCISLQIILFFITELNSYYLASNASELYAYYMVSDFLSNIEDENLISEIRNIINENDQSKISSISVLCDVDREKLFRLIGEDTTIEICRMVG